MLENFLGNKTAWKILRILSEAPGKGVTRSEIKALTKAGNLALSNSLKELETYGIIKKGRKEGRILAKYSKQICKKDSGAF